MAYFCQNQAYYIRDVSISDFDGSHLLVENVNKYFEAVVDQFSDKEEQTKNL